jgi:2-keto-3-deoxy-L-rhamnonate aldolase RhmA
MEISPNEFKRQLTRRGVAYGLFSGLVDSATTEVIASAGFDWMLIDGEHAPHDLRSIMAQLQAAAPYDGPVLVRPEFGKYRSDQTTARYRCADAAVPHGRICRRPKCSSQQRGTRLLAYR